MSEISKYRSLVAQYCVGNGCDVGSGGDPMAAHGISIDLPEKEYAIYNAGHAPFGPIHYRAVDAALNLPFKDGVLDWVGSVHVLEDFIDWTPLLREWGRVLKPGGYMIILLPDRQRFLAALARGLCPNDAHRHEGRVGELSEHLIPLGFEVIEDRLTDLTPEDYSILGVFRKK